MKQAVKVKNTLDKAQKRILSDKLSKLTEKYSKLVTARDQKKYAASYYEGVVVGLNTAHKVVNGVDDDETNPLET